MHRGEFQVVCSGALSRLVSPFEVTALTELGSYSESSATRLRRAACGHHGRSSLIAGR